MNRLVGIRNDDRIIFYNTQLRHIYTDTRFVGDLCFDIWRSSRTIGCIDIFIRDYDIYLFLFAEGNSFSFR